VPKVEVVRAASVISPKAPRVSSFEGERWGVNACRDRLGRAAGCADDCTDWGVWTEVETRGDDVIPAAVADGVRMEEVLAVVQEGGICAGNMGASGFAIAISGAGEKDGNAPWVARGPALKVLGLSGDGGWGCELVGGPAGETLKVFVEVEVATLIVVGAGMPR
jgi:hypothetical protein